MRKAAKASGVVRQMQEKRARKVQQRMALIMAAKVPNQETLDDILLREPDHERRKVLFQFMRPALRFPNPRCPAEIEC